MSENNDTSNESNSIGSDSILQASRLGNSTGGSGGSSINLIANPILRSGVLRPSVLGPSVLSSALTNTTNSNSCSSNAIAVASTAATSGTPADHNIKVDNKLNTSMSKNPFMKEQSDENELEKETNGAHGDVADTSEVKVNATTSRKADTTKNKNNAKDDEEPDERADPLKLLRKNGLERANLFAAAKNSIPRVEKSGFVFGQNVHERVVGENIHADSTSKDETAEATSSQMLFSSVIQSATNKPITESDGLSALTKETESKTLNDVAREYEESRAQKRKYEEVETFTGEENEVNVVDINCKLFAFENSTWEERGRGNLRLNDSKIQTNNSRVVFRTSGSLRLFVNTKVWREMVAERPSHKSLRFTAMDNNATLKIFLAMGRPADISQLHKALTERICKQKKNSTVVDCDDGSSAADTKNKMNDDNENDASTVIVVNNSDSSDEPVDSTTCVEGEEQEDADAEAKSEAEDDADEEEQTKVKSAIEPEAEAKAKSSKISDEAVAYEPSTKKSVTSNVLINN